MLNPNVGFQVVAGKTDQGLRAWTGPVRPMSSPHRHHDAEFNHVAAGWVEYVVAGRRVRLEQDESALFWGAVPHQLVAAAADARMGWVVGPVPWVLGMTNDDRILSQFLTGRMFVETAAQTQDAPAIERWHQMLGRCDPQWQRIAELEIESRFRRLFLDGAWTPDHPAESRKTNRHDPGTIPIVERMARFLTEHYHEPVRVADVADHVAVHPHHAMRLFREQLGMTIVQYLTQQRLAEAQRRLITTEARVLDIGLACGFGSASQFHKVFCQHLHLTPARYRRLKGRKLKASHPPQG